MQYKSWYPQYLKLYACWFKKKIIKCVLIKVNKNVQITKLCPKQCLPQKKTLREKECE